MSQCDKAGQDQPWSLNGGAPSAQVEFASAAFVDQIFPGVPEDFLGQARIESDSNFYLLVVRQELVGSGFQITTTPATPLLP